jgi:hypothetical protein
VSERRINLLLWSMAGCFAAATVAAIAAAFLIPLESTARNATPTARPASQSLASRDAPSLAEFEPIFNAVLRPAPTEALTEATVVADAAPAPTAPDGFALTLVGTIGQSLAMLRNAQGEVELRGVGDTAGGATVVSIQPSRVEMQHNGRSIVLEKPKEPATGS